MQAGHRNAYECIKAFSETDFRADLARFDVPTLVMHGDDDQVVPFDVGGQASARLIAGAMLIVYQGAPHGITDTHKDQLGKDLLAFLEERDVMSALPRLSRRFRVPNAWPWRAARCCRSVSLADAVETPAAETAAAGAPKPTIVLVHGAFADAGGLERRLRAPGAQGLQRDRSGEPAPRPRQRTCSTSASFIDTVEGPIVLVGHSYGGFVMTNAADRETPTSRRSCTSPPSRRTRARRSEASRRRRPAPCSGPAALTIRPYTKADGTQGADGYITPSLYRECVRGRPPAAHGVRRSRSRSGRQTLSILRRTVGRSGVEDDPLVVRWSPARTT